MRALATACENANRGVPAVHAVAVEADTIRFHLSTPDERPPSGWTSDHDGRTWYARLRQLQSASVAESLEEPYPQLVSLGSTSKAFVLLNLGQAGGIIGLEGDAGQARALAHDWTRELAASPWSREVQVVRVGFRSGVADVAGATEAKTLLDAEAALAADGEGVLLLAGLPSGRDRERVYRLADEPGGRWSVIVVGRVEHPRWRLRVDSAGTVDTGLLDEPVAHRLNPSAEEPAPEGEDADPVAEPLGGTTPGGRRPVPSFTRRWAVFGAVAVVVACLAGAAVFLAPGGTSVSPASAAKASHNDGALPAASGSSPTAAGSANTTPTATSAANAVGFVNQLTGKCLSGSAGTDGTPLVLSACSSDPNQQWVLASDGTIQTKGLCMDAAWAGTATGTVVQIARCSGNPAQQFMRRGDTLYSVQAKKCVDELSGGTQVRLYPCSTSTSEVFNRD